MTLLLYAQFRTLKWTCACLGLLALLLPDTLQATTRPNILFILADDLGYADLGAYGNRQIETPHIDRLAQEGLRFTHFYSNGAVCTPTRAALLTGQYPQRFGAQLREGLRPGSEHGIPSDAPSLPRQLRQAGYHTYHVGKWHIGHARREYRPLAKGYEGFFGFLHPKYLPDGYRNPLLQRGEDPPRQHEGHLTDLLTAEAADFLRRQSPSGPPFFLTLWSFAPHLPLTPPERWAERYSSDPRGRYAALVSALDESVGTLLGILEERGLARNTLVIFASDNGGHHLTHGDRNGPLLGGKNHLQEGGIRVPLIVRWPGRVQPGTVSTDRILGFDWVPTLAEVAGAPFPAGTLDGQSLLPILAGKHWSDERTMFWDDLEPNERFAISRGSWKLLSTSGKRQLFDLQSDPGESRNRLPEKRDLARSMAAEYGLWRLKTGRIPLLRKNAEGDPDPLTGNLKLKPSGTITLADAPGLDPHDGALSFAAWFCPQSSCEPVATTLVRKGDAWHLGLDNQGRLHLEANGARIEATIQWTKEPCQHIAFTYAHPGLKSPADKTSGDLRLYVNGALAGETRIPQSLRPTVHGVHFGASSEGGRPFIGTLHQISFYRLPLSAREIGELSRKLPETTPLSPEPAHSPR